jgi:hypothetical protein
MLARGTFKGREGSRRALGVASLGAAVGAMSPRAVIEVAVGAAAADGAALGAAEKFLAAHGRAALT